MTTAKSHAKTAAKTKVAVKPAAKPAAAKTVKADAAKGKGKAATQTGC